MNGISETFYVRVRWSSKIVSIECGPPPVTEHGLDVELLVMPGSRKGPLSFIRQYIHSFAIIVSEGIRIKINSRRTL